VKNVVIFTGAGISAESGIKTFRDYDGLWENFKVEDVATPEGFFNNPQMVWKFYKDRHDQLTSIEPNKAHKSITSFQESIKDNDEYRVVVITQNIDRLHQTSGTKNVIELHGNLHDVKCSCCDYVESTQIYWEHSVIPNCPRCGEYLRPDVVWFGENLDHWKYKRATTAIENCSDIIVIGTSCNVYPAFSLVEHAVSLGANLYECNLEKATNKIEECVYVQGKATETVPKLLSTIYLKTIFGWKE